MVVKNWRDELHLNCTPIVILENYMKVEYPLVEKNYGLIEVGYFE
jgi:hypothetical protein